MDELLEGRREKGREECTDGRLCVKVGEMRGREGLSEGERKKNGGLDV